MQIKTPVRPSSSWTWRIWQDKPFLTCNLIPQPHGFFTRHFHPLAPEDLVRILRHPKDAVANSVAEAAVYRVKQVHSGNVLMPAEIESIRAAGLPQSEDGSLVPFPLADGLVSDRPWQSVWACSADCTPALISDIVTGRVAAVHAGWRGTAQKIVPAAVTRMLEQGSELSNISVALGPAIDGSVYQVMHDVAAKVGASIVSERDGLEESLLAQLMAMKNPPVLSDQRAGRVRLDVRRVNQTQLEQMGLAVEQIAIAPHCTFQEPENFFSYRRTGAKQVQWAGIISS
ncbi:MAG: peptidoglycan editing factor PgeF [Phormidesmis sp.]